MKANPLARILTTFACLLVLTLLTGCFDTTDEYTLNPDGSGKVVHESRFQNMNLSGGDDSSEDALKEVIAKVIENAKGVEAWRDVTYKRLDDGRFYFKGTAYFKDLSKLDFPNQTMLEFNWNKTPAGGVLTLRTNKEDDAGPGMHVESKTEDLSKLSPEERAKKIKEARNKFQQAKPMLSGMLVTMKHTVILHLPGTVTEHSNLTTDDAGALHIEFSGAKLIEAMDQLVNDDAWLAKNVNAINGTAESPLDDEVNAQLFGTKGPVRAAFSGGTAAFDYATEVAAAKQEFAKTQKQLGTSPVTIAPPAEGGELKSVKVVGVRLVRESDEKREMRPFNYDEGYTLALLGELPGSVLAITEESGLDTAVADDGSNLLPERSWDRRFNFPHLTKDKASVVFEAKLSVPGPGVKGLKEVSGHLQYRVAGSTMEVDLGFTELKPGASGTEMGAKIESIEKGWKDNGSQQMGLKLKISKDALKAIYLVENGQKTELDQRGYSGGMNSFTFNYESKTAFPTDGHLVAEIYDEMQTFNVPFKLENISLLGEPMDAK